MRRALRFVVVLGCVLAAGCGAGGDAGPTPIDRDPTLEEEEVKVPGVVGFDGSDAVSAVEAERAVAHAG